MVHTKFPDVVIVKVLQYLGGGIGDGGGSTWMSQTTHWTESNRDSVVLWSTVAARDAVWYGSASHGGALSTRPPPRHGGCVQGVCPGAACGACRSLRLAIPQHRPTGWGSYLPSRPSATGSVVPDCFLSG